MCSSSSSPDRRLMLFPRGGHGQPPQKFFSLFLDAPEAAFTPAHMAPRATFSIGLINQIPGRPPLMKGVWEVSMGGSGLTGPAGSAFCRHKFQGYFRFPGRQFGGFEFKPMVKPMGYIVAWDHPALFQVHLKWAAVTMITYRCIMHTEV